MPEDCTFYILKASIFLAKVKRSTAKKVDERLHDGNFKIKYTEIFVPYSGKESDLKIQYFCPPSMRVNLT